MSDMKIDMKRYLELSIDDRKDKIQQKLSDVFRCGEYAILGMHTKCFNENGEKKQRRYNLDDVDCELRELEDALDTYRKELQMLYEERYPFLR